MFGEIGPEKLLVILLIVLVLFGGKRIPEIGASLGKGIREFKKSIKEVGDSVHEEPVEPVRQVSALPPAQSVAYDESHAAPKRLIDN
jgi:sec-independent protein translocase protein TatA